MTDNKPDVIDLSKTASTDTAEDTTEADDTEEVEAELDTEAETEKASADSNYDPRNADSNDVYEETRETYPEDLQDSYDDDGPVPSPDSPAEDRKENYPDDLEDEMPDTQSKADDGHVHGPAMKGQSYRLEDDEIYCESEGEVFRDSETSGETCPHCGDGIAKADGEDGDEKAFEYEDYDIKNKVTDKGFADAETGDKVLISTPLEGAKVGEVVSAEKAWTGSLHLKVDTGANQYDITPYDDEYSEKFLAVVDEGDGVNHQLLRSLGKVSPDAVEPGDQVVIDVPTVGAVKGEVAHKAETETQGHKIDVKCGPVYFKLYEEPTSAMRKEQPYLVGRVNP